MSGYGLTSAGAYANQAKSAIRPVRRIRKEKKMKLTLKQRFRNWLNDTDDDQYIPDRIEVDSISSNGMRFNLYKASGGFVIETKLYDERNDRNINKLHVITEDKDLGDELGKIITMESLR